MARVPSTWFMEFVTPDTIQQFAVKDILYFGRSKYQTVEVIETVSFGKCLILDGKIQSCEKDEFIYHEALVHPAMILHPNPETVFIAGGGEGATLREVLAHKTVKRVVMVDIDAEVIDICQRLLPAHQQGSFDDPRVELLHRDAREYLAETRERFDVIIIDLPDPIEGGPAYLLYTQKFYQLLRSKLIANGALALQAGSTRLNETKVCTAVNNTLKTIFPIVATYETDIPSFGGPWGFSLASLKFDPFELSSGEIDGRIGGRVGKRLDFYDGQTHQGLFFIPKYLRDAMARETMVISEDNPVFIP
ncbi:MAG: polyamine aminopropyltransferase [Dehalococcoidia bacterium]|nr:Polyamine aminopropyltransferase [Chloroflexota bacterium]MBT9160268.1 Polyamine aminopropyltransferase [Chloroflexota bacterium]MBT9161930.1 Polyamine aminopropyltransferase [Chloroflexota bacterium]